MGRKPRGSTFHNSADFKEIPQDTPREVALVEFAKRVRQAMNEQGLSQSELARLATLQLGSDIGRDSVSQWLRAVTFPNPERLHAIAKVLKKEPSDLLPTRGVRRAEDKVAPVDVRQMTDGSAWLQINQQVPWDKAVKILSILKEES